MIIFCCKDKMLLLTVFTVFVLMLWLLGSLLGLIFANFYMGNEERITFGEVDRLLLYCQYVADIFPICKDNFLTGNFYCVCIDAVAFRFSSWTDLCQLLHGK